MELTFPHTDLDLRLHSSCCCYNPPTKYERLSESEGRSSSRSIGGGGGGDGYGSVGGSNKDDD